MATYTASPHPPSHLEMEKEHVLVCAHISVAGRKGILLLDPGYHVARVITVMEDCLYPHTGWFTQSDEGTVKKEYMYAFGNNRNYVVWEVAETRGHTKKTCLSLIYIARAFCSAVDVTERRNLVYDFRSWLARDTKGQITAGIYFSVPQVITLDGLMLTLLYTDPLTSVKHRLKLSFSSFMNQMDVQANVATIIDLCGDQLGLPPGRLSAVLNSLASILSDTSFISQLYYINQEIINSP